FCCRILLLSPPRPRPFPYTTLFRSLPRACCASMRAFPPPSSDWRRSSSSCFSLSRSVMSVNGRGRGHPGPDVGAEGNQFTPLDAHEVRTADEHAVLDREDAGRTAQV